MAESATHNDPESSQTPQHAHRASRAAHRNRGRRAGPSIQERTSTLSINCHGCRYQSKHYVLKNMWVTLEVPHPEAGRRLALRRGRVTWIQRPRTVRELFQIGVEMEIPGNIWGIAFPPPDWFAADPSATSPTLPIHDESPHPRRFPRPPSGRPAAAAAAAR